MSGQAFNSQVNKMENNIKTLFFLGGLTALLVFIGGVLGGHAGMLIALLFAGIINFSAYWYSDTIVLNLYQAQLASSTHFVYRIVEELAHRAGTPMPLLQVATHKMQVLL